MELNVGDYVRTKYGISKIEEDRKIKFGLIHPVVDILKKETIIKSSPKIIDLIEVGDYVNDYYVENITNTGEELVLHIITGSNYFQSPFLYNEDIKSVLTHEQFEAMKYVVDEE